MGRKSNLVSRVSGDIRLPWQQYHWPERVVPRSIRLEDERERQRLRRGRFQSRPRGWDCIPAARLE